MGICFFPRLWLVRFPLNACVPWKCRNAGRAYFLELLIALTLVMDTNKIILRFLFAGFITKIQQFWAQRKLKKSKRSVWQGYYAMRVKICAKYHWGLSSRAEHWIYYHAKGYHPLTGNCGRMPSNSECIVFFQIYICSGSNVCIGKIF